ncbi:alpha/beta hydrolase [Patescibacteria group bacterium AH-259-L07]|nr:alpha/beta hydrolase [Patescibacteria group bacterium AH-259-L07]
MVNKRANLKHVFIIHGWGASPDSNWFPWLKKQLAGRGFIVTVPQMPNTLTPDFDAWLSYIQKIVGKVDNNTYLVGHSLGVITILRFLESLDKDQRIGGTILVAGFSELPSPVDHLLWLHDFVEKSVNYAKIKERVGKIIVIHSDNDHLVPLESGEILRKLLGAELIVVPHAGHFLVRESPLILKNILKIADKEEE